MLHQKSVPALFLMMISRIMALSLSVVFIALFVGYVLPNTKILAYESNHNIYLADIDRNIQCPITDSDDDLFFYGSPAFSPDGAHIAFIAGNENGGGQIYVMDMTGHNPQPLTKDFALVYGSISWSPDSKQIVYSHRRVEENQLHILNIEDRVVTSIKFEDFDLTLAAAWPEWSPDGKQIAFLSDKGMENGLDLFVYDVESQKLRQLTDNTNALWKFSWSPDGENIIIPVQRIPGELVEDFYAINLRNNQQSPVITIDTPHKDNPIWSPDGQQLVFTMSFFGADRSFDRTHLYIMDAHGNNLRRITNSDHNEESPSWRP